MNSMLLSVALILSLAVGCGGSAALPQADAPVKSPMLAKAPTAAIDDNEADRKDVPPMDADKAFARMPGDFIVHRFSGSFRETPITLTQRVTAREGDVLVIDMTFDEGGSKQALRVKIDDTTEKRGEVMSVARLANGSEEPASIETYEQLMAKTALAADQNEEVLGSEAVTIDVGGAALACQKTSYRVRIGKHHATLRTVQSEKFSWGDLSGEITSEGGDIVYRAELVEAGRGEAQKPAVARSDYDDEQ